MTTARTISPWRLWDGPLTRELVQEPARFGLGRLPARLHPDGTASMVCGYCSTGCSLTVHLKDGKPVNLTPDPAYPVNLGMACPKGWEALTPLQADDRATTPLLRNSRGNLEPVDWDTAMQVFTLRLKAIQDKFGPESVAWLGTGQIVTEEMALLGALGKFGMGIIHGDANTRQCMATSVVAYKQSFGFDAPPFAYSDFEESDVIFLIGSNLCIAHPILWQRVLRNKNNPEIIVVDPRKTETAAAATRHCAIRPGSDLALLYGLAHILARRGWIDESFIEKHTSGFGEFKAFLDGADSKTNASSPESVAAETGLSVEELVSLAEIIHRGRRVSFWWTMGVNQGHQATRTAQAIINLALMTGNIGRPGTGANSITGQCNAMGSRLFSNTTNLLGGRDFLNPVHRRDVANSLEIDAARIPGQNSLAYDQILDRVAAGQIKALWIIATNTAHSWISRPELRAIFEKLDFLVVQDMYATTETARLAHLVLPAAGWGEKEGTFINSERRIGLAKKISRAPGEALSDFNIFRLAAHYWGCADLFSRWTSPEAVFQILKELSRGQPCDITGIRDYQMLDECGGVQWPWKESASRHAISPAPDHAALVPAQERRLFEDGRFFTPDERARFIFEASRPLPEPPCGDYPFLLLTGRGSSAQWHTQSRTGKSEVLRSLYPAEIYAEIHPLDAAALEIENHQRIEVVSRRGQISVRAVLTSSLQRGQIFIPMHYVETNELTRACFDPYSRQPAYKACAAAIRLPEK